MSDELDAEITDAVVSGVVDGVSEIRSDGRQPAAVSINTESLEAVLRHIPTVGVTTTNAAYLFGLPLTVDNSLRLGAVRVTA